MFNNFKDWYVEAFENAKVFLFIMEFLFLFISVAQVFYCLAETDWNLFFCICTGLLVELMYHICIFIFAQF